MAEAARPAKRVRLLADDEQSSSETESIDGGAALTNGSLKINEEYAKRFEHNSKRAERQRLEEKYKEDLSEDDSTSEEEDDFGDLVTEDVDANIAATINALRSKDPRIYDKKTAFFEPVNADTAVAPQAPKDKPLYLKDYHRQNLLNGVNGTSTEDEPVAMTYADEQDALKRDLVGQLQAVEASDSDNDDFLRKKDKSAHDDIKVHPSRRKAHQQLNIEDADKDPETYLSNFLASRAWVPNEKSRFAHLDSDDSEDEERAEEFEAAYNMRFEDPETANAKLVSFSRDVGKYSARREEKSGRQKQREKEREAQEARRKERQDDKARLRRLRIEEIEGKVKQIKEAAGLGPVDVVNLEEWGNVLDDDFDDGQWEQEMQRRFGDKYYAEKDVGVDEADGEGKGSKKVKKPKWDDDIDINDLVPGFEEDERDSKPAFTLSDDDGGDDADENAQDGDVDIVEGDALVAKQTALDKHKSKKEAQAERKRAARKQRMAIEELVDADLTLSLSSKSARRPDTREQQDARAVGFRYRETSPAHFGLSARDILFADDAALNSFAGIKKTHAFRDEDKKARDRKKLGKKARLREWRRDTFGNEEGYQGRFADYVKEKGGVVEDVRTERRGGQPDKEGKKKKRKR